MTTSTFIVFFIFKSSLSSGRLPLLSSYNPIIASGGYAGGYISPVSGSVLAKTKKAPPLHAGAPCAADSAAHEKAAAPSGGRFALRPLFGRLKMRIA
ncbi:MAG: hypothetical protein RR337_02335 [Clostridia bacterium]